MDGSDKFSDIAGVLAVLFVLVIGIVTTLIGLTI